MLNIFAVSPNLNVRLAIAFAAANSMALGIWSYTVLSSWLQQMPQGTNARVGIAEGIQGTVQGIAAIPAGFLADSIGREVVLKGSSFIGMISVVLLMYTLLGRANHDPLDGRTMPEMPDKYHQFEWMTLSLGFVGMYTGIYSSALEAIFHDSVTSEERTKVTTAKYIADIVFNAAGPITSLILFLFIGDSWAFEDITDVMVIGVVISIIPIAMLFFFRDAYSLGRESEPLTYASPELSPRVGGINAIGMMTDLDEDETGAVRPMGDALAQDDIEEPLISGHSAMTAEERAHIKRCHWWVPRVLVTADMISGLASGMTIKFFPLFFKDETELPPSATNAIFALSPILMVIFSTAAMSAAKQIGRVNVPFFTNVFGIACLVIMWYLGTFKNDDGEQYLWKNWKIIVPLYLVRTAAMNCAFPLRKSILMDYVPKEDRGKWNSLESICQFGWSGSAVLGGWLTEKYGYGGTFLATAGLQAISLAFFGTLKWLHVRD